MKVLDPTATYMGYILTTQHNGFLFQHHHIWHKATQYQQKDIYSISLILARFNKKNLNLHLSYSPPDDIIFNNTPSYTGCNCYSINYPETLHGRATRLMTKINVAPSSFCFEGMVDFGFYTGRFLPLNCDHIKKTNFFTL